MIDDGRFDTLSSGKKTLSAVILLNWLPNLYFLVVNMILSTRYPLAFCAPYLALLQLEGPQDVFIAGVIFGTWSRAKIQYPLVTDILVQIYRP